MKLKKVLVANRGEIAVRVIRGLRELGISSVAVFSEADRKALHVQMADQALCIGPPAPTESYLNMDAIVAAAKKSGAVAIHPGYGFLSENFAFARRCEKEGLIFVGPTSAALALVGDKVASRLTMSKAGIPIIPGMSSKGTDPARFPTEAKKIGYPVLIKASAGGGGKGMMVINSPKELKAAVEASMRVAGGAFGDESVYLEKYLPAPRHVEFQVLADTRGNVVHLFERECSIQRRHQKIVEETPSVALDDELRTRMGQAAVAAVEAAGYTNAGTVEFLLDDEGHFYFLEVNARLQVEHPITEMTAGVDLVHQQIAIAAGKKLTFGQKDIRRRGHAIECRIYAEDPANGFMPSSGQVLFLKEPSGPGVRHDCGIYSGCTVPVHYDPILSKVIVWAENRETARKRMLLALSEMAIMGIHTTVPFLQDVVAHEEFAAGNTHTDFIDKYMTPWKQGADGELLDVILAAAAVDARNRTSAVAGPSSSPRRRLSPWQTGGGWRIGGV
ncbi:acetyl/propionyl/methylcrotonyl-CoA carboxylase subunit alpha [Candidatus Zixiibacteriota bacterium]